LEKAMKRNSDKTVLQFLRTNPDHDWTTAEMKTHLDPGYGWALTKLKRQGLLVNAERGIWRLTDKGKTAR
jgi:restriction endonuclease Mrr